MEKPRKLTEPEKADMLHLLRSAVGGDAAAKKLREHFLAEDVSPARAPWDRQIEERARRKCGCKQCDDPEKHPCGTVLSKVMPVVMELLLEARDDARRE